MSTITSTIPARTFYLRAAELYLNLGTDIATQAGTELENEAFGFSDEEHITITHQLPRVWVPTIPASMRDESPEYLFAFAYEHCIKIAGGPSALAKELAR